MRGPIEAHIALFRIVKSSGDGNQIQIRMRIAFLRYSDGGKTLHIWRENAKGGGKQRFGGGKTVFYGGKLLITEEQLICVL